MKFNLKNRPLMMQEGKDEFDVLYEMTKWFEGFEKELREMHRKVKDLPKNHVVTVYLKEILGE